MALVLEQLWVVEGCTVNAALVLSFFVYYFIAERLQLLLIAQILEHTAVLNLRQSDEGRTCRSHFVLEVGKYRSHVLQFVLVLQSCPMIASVWQKLIVVFMSVVDCIEQVLLIIECHAIYGILFSRVLRQCTNWQHQLQHNKCTD